MFAVTGVKRALLVVGIMALAATGALVWLLQRSPDVATTSGVGPTAAAYVDTSIGGVDVSRPRTWTQQTALPDSPGLVALARGPTAAPGCPLPVLLLRTEGSTTASLAQAVDLYQRFEQARRPGRELVEERRIEVEGGAEAVLLVADVPAGEMGVDVAAGSDGTMTTYDLLVLGDDGRAHHLFASGCRADLPEDFLEEAVLSFAARAS